jgi:FkbM family methyltransferase
MYRAGLYHEKEVALLGFLVRPGKLAIDVGAHVGGYTHILLQLKMKVLAIEANPHTAARLRRVYGDRAQIVWGAVSSASGTVTLRIPVRSGIATIERHNKLENSEINEVDVPMLCLDEMALEPVGFIKIDVEGHELDVLKGARRLLQRDHPAILVEAEERHRPASVATLRQFLEPLGYHGFMLDNGRLTSLRHFDSAIDQSVPPGRLDDLNAGNYDGRYINNFIFLA